MNENTKTLTFVGAAALVGLIVWFSRPSLPSSDSDDRRGQLLVADFPVENAASLDVLEFDEGTATVRPFHVARVQVKGKTRWSIPSHENYPADAKDHLAEVATGLMGLKILDVASTDQGDHSLYRVVDPGAKDLKVGATGVGTRVTMRDKDNKELLSLIIGKEVPDRPGLRYVRQVGEDAVYVVAAKTDKLSTKFADWIEKDLLKLSTWDVRQLWIRDHSVDALRGRLKQNGELTLTYDDAASDKKWKLTKDEKPGPDGKWTPLKMGDDQELDTSKLDDLKSALGDLKIVDVRPKPAGLTANLKGGKDLVKSEQDVASLQEKGFFLARLEDSDQAEVFSNNGEIRALMKDGVEYVLRFGGVAGSEGGSSGKKDDKKKDDKKSESAGVNRYLFAMAEFNPAIIAKPTLEPLPTEKKEEKKEEKKDDKAKDAKKDEKKEEKKDDKKDLKAERERIEKENKRKQDDYDEQIKKGKDRVAELNARFADWYYVISDDVFRKIHLSRDQILKKKEKKEESKDKKEAAGHEGHDHEHSPVGEFNKLKKDGPGKD